MKKTSKRILSVVMAVIMMLSTMFASSVFAASKPGKVKVTSTGVNTAKKSITLKWKKVKGAKGYVIQKNTKKKFTKIKGVTVKKRSKTFKKLKVGKTYYFRLRAYKLSGKTKVYGKATIKKVVLVKKAVAVNPNNPVLTTQPTNNTQQPTQAVTTKVTTTAKPTTVPQNLTPVVVWKDGECWTSQNDFVADNGVLYFDSTNAFVGNQYQIGSWNKGSFTTEAFGNAAYTADGFIAAVKIDSAKALSGQNPTKLDVVFKITVDGDGTYIAGYNGIIIGGGVVQAKFPVTNFIKDGSNNQKITREQLKKIVNIELTINSYESFWGNDFTSVKGCYSSVYTYKGPPGVISLPNDTPVITAKPTTAKPTVETPPATNEFDTLLGMSKKTVGNTMTSPITNDRYTLKFIDDFNGTTLNSSNWSYYTRNYNSSEESVNRKENVVVQNGMLNIYGKKENQKYTGSAESWETPKTSYFTGGAINSQGKKTFKYGRLEIYCRIPYSYGMWPAFWTQGTQSGWPWGGEIDIMEFVGGVDQYNNYRDDEYHCGLHWSDPTTPSDKAWGTNLILNNGDPDSKWNRTDVKMNTGGNFEIPNGPSKGAKLHDKWRVCGLEWNETTMYFYSDDKVFHQIDITKTSMREAFHQNHYIILNLVMGGGWAGTPNESKGTVFPQNFQVDWVKVWQK